MFKKKLKGFKAKSIVGVLEKLNFNYYSQPGTSHDKSYFTINNLYWFFPVSQFQKQESKWKLTTIISYDFSQMSSDTWNYKVKNIDKDILSNKQIKEAKFNYAFINLAYDKNISNEVKKQLIINPKTKTKINNLLKRKIQETKELIGNIGFGSPGHYGNVTINDFYDLDKDFIYFDFKFNKFKNAKPARVYEISVFEFIQESNLETERKIRKYFGVGGISIQEYFEKQKSTQE